MHLQMWNESHGRAQIDHEHRLFGHPQMQAVRQSSRKLRLIVAATDKSAVQNLSTHVTMV